MQAADRAEFLRIVNGLAAIKPGAKISTEALSVWWDAMRDWLLEDFRAAASHLARTSEFMPNPYHFEQLRKAARLTAAEAWERARAACGSAIVAGRVTHNGTCGDALIDRAVRGIGGYGVIAMCESDKLPFLERRFAEHYATLEDANDVRETLPQIAPDPTRSLPSLPPTLALRATQNRAVLPPAPIALTKALLPAPRDNQADIRKLAAAGLGVDEIAKMLAQRHVTLEEVQRALEVAA